MPKPEVAVDFDAVLCSQVHGEWKGVDVFGLPIPGAVEFTRALSEHADVIVHTCRTNPELARPRSPVLVAIRIRKWLDLHGFAYAHVWTGVGKPIARAYVDDRAVSCEPQIHGEEAFRMALLRVCDLCGTPASPPARSWLDDRDASLSARSESELLARRKALLDKAPDLQFWLLTDAETLELMKIQNELAYRERETP